MFKKLTCQFSGLGIAAIIVACVLSMTMFYSSGHQSLAQNTRLSLAQNTKLSLAPNPANPGATIMVNGFEYQATEKVEVYFQDRANGVVSVTTNAGGFFNAPLTLPEKYIDGPTYVYATSDNHTTKALLNFVKPALTYTREQKSARASFKGTGFSANEPVSFVLSEGNKTVKMGTQRTDSQGHFAFTLALPDMPLDSKATLTVTDRVRKKPVSIHIHYSPQIHLSSFVGPIKTVLKVTGKGFKQRETVHVSFQGRVVATVVADRNGNFVTQFHPPAWAGSTPYYNNVKATGTQSKASASDSFQVLPSVSFNLNTGGPGQQVIATGSQFTAHKPVQVLLFSPSGSVSSVGRPLEDTGVSSQGTFLAHFTIPHNVQRRKVYSILYIDVASGLNVVTYFKVQ